MNTRYFLTNGTRLTFDEAIRFIHAGEEVRVAAPSIGNAVPSPDDCVSVTEVRKDVFEITAPDGTVMDTVRYIVVDALQAAGDFVRPFSFVLDRKIAELELDVMSLEASGDGDLAANAARELHTLKRVKAHLAHEAKRRGEPTREERPEPR